MNTVTASSPQSSLPAPKDTTSVKAQTDRFLKILTTQLQNQNPLDPMKPAEFTAQLTQYSQLEQQIKMNENFNKLIASSGKPAVSPLTYLNTTVDYASDTAPVQDGKASWNYLANGASAVRIRIEDATGRTVYSAAGSTAAGTHRFEFPTTALGAGTPLKMIVNALDAEGKVVTSSVNARAKVTAVNTANGASLLEASGYIFGSDKVTRVEAI